MTLLKRGLFSVVFLSLLTLLTAGCGGQAVNPELDSSPSASENHQSSGFSLNVWSESYLGDSSADFSLRTTETTDGVKVSIEATDASDLKALYFDLAYDPAAYSPVEAVATGTLAGENELLELAVLDRRGVVYHGQVLIQPQHSAGFSGTSVLATVTFEKGSAPTQRSLSAAPISDRSRAELVFESDSGELVWEYASQGDYDQNSETNIADLTPLGVHFRKDGPFDVHSVEWVVDGDGNGEINVSDITPIGINFQRRVSSYNIYISGSEDSYPDSNAAASSLASLAALDYQAFEGNRGTERIRFRYTFTEELEDQFCWVRPADAGQEGTPSELIQVTVTGVEAPTNLAPIARITTPVSSGDVPFAVNFDAATSSDADGTITQYEWDLDGDPGFELNSGAVAQAGHVYNEPGIYNARVRVTDDGGASSVASMFVSANVEGNPAPVAVIEAAPLSGPAPLQVDFDASESSDANGTIVKYEWDFDGDGNFDMDTGTEPTASHTFSSKGKFDAAVKVTDDQGSSDIARLSDRAVSSGGVNVEDPSGGPNEDPVASITADPLSGELPLTVDFDGSASTDPEGGSLTFLWDFNGDGMIDLNSGSDPTVSFTYVINGEFDASVRVEDSAGGFDTARLSDIGAVITAGDGGGGGPNQDRPRCSALTSTSAQRR